MRLSSGIKTIAILGLAAVVLSACASVPSGLSPLDTVPSVDPIRYLGRWYEVARFQHSVEKNLVGATAEYSLKPDGTIAVLNSGFKKTLDGPYTSVTAVARIPDSSKPGRLKVKFFGLFESDYLIFGLDDVDYSWALVGNEGRDYLWFLSRTPTVDDALLGRMKAIAVAQGYDLAGLYLVPQKERKE